MDALARAGEGDRLRVVAGTLGIGGPGAADAATIRSRLQALQAKAAIPSRLAPLGVRADQIDALVEYTVKDRALDTNPVPITRADIAVIFGEAL